MTTSVLDLPPVGSDILRLCAILGTVLAENFWHKVPWLHFFVFLVLGVRVRVVVPFGNINFDL